MGLKTRSGAAALVGRDFVGLLVPTSTSSESNSVSEGIGAGTVARRRADGSFECLADDVAVEEPLEIRIGAKAVAITMRTPGHDEELAAGFLFGEGVLKNREEVQAIGPSVRMAGPGNFVDVKLTRPHGSARPMQRFGTISTSCGLCGKASIEEIRSQFPALPRLNPASLNVAVLLGMPDQLRQAQGNFARTGGLHAGGVFDLTGRLLVIREDVGRHNAVDKAIGHLFLDGLVPLHQHVLLVSGRASLEIVQKALAAGIPVVASVSAPSTLAVQFARETGMTLIGFLRPPTFNVYAHVERLAAE